MTLPMSNEVNVFDRITLLAADDFYKAALHEAGHVVVAQHRRLDSSACIWPTTKRPTVKTKAFAGATQLQMGVRSLDRALVGWGGILSERLADLPLDDWLPDLGVSSTEWEFLMDELSATDRSLVLEYRAPWRTLESAASILARRAEAVATTACRLIDDCAKGCYKQEAIEFRSDQQERTAVHRRSGQWWPRPKSLEAQAEIALARLKFKFRI